MRTPQGIEYRLLPIPFSILTFVGFWFPTSMTPRKRALYRLLTIFYLVCMISFLVEGTVNIIITLNTDDFNMDNVFAFSIVFTGLLKAIKILRERQVILSFLNVFTNKQWYCTQNREENLLRVKCDRETRQITLIYAAGIFTGVGARAITPFFKEENTFALPLDVWCPYDPSVPLYYVLTYIHQVIAGLTPVLMHLTVDSIFFALLLRMCLQCDIFRHRLKVFPEICKRVQKCTTAKSMAAIEKEMIAKLVHDHESIFRLGERVNSQFIEILFIQILVSIPNICLTVYLLSQMDVQLNMDIISMLLSFAAGFTQLYLFCSYGNKVSLCSLGIRDAVYDTDWTVLSVSTRKTLIMIMLRASKSIKVVAGSIFTMDINFFISILKTSYSAFRVLKDAN